MEGIRLRSGIWDDLAAQCRLVRDEVFVVEQGVPVALEHDSRDAECLHALASLADGSPVATGRLLADGRIGRIAVRRPWRGQGVGGAILALLIEEARERSLQKVYLDSQLQVTAFYRGFGFSEVGETFVEAGIDHQRMELRL